MTQARSRMNAAAKPKDNAVKGGQPGANICDTLPGGHTTHTQPVAPSMPVVKVKVKDGAPPFALVFPRRVELEGGEHSWEWDEVQVVDSAIDDAGFGLATRNTESLNWRALSGEAGELALFASYTEGFRTQLPKLSTRT